MTELIIKGYFFEYGKNAPKNCEFKGIVDHDTLLGGGRSFFQYTDREQAVKDSAGSYAGYTSRGNATENSAPEYFTMSNMGHLFTEEDRSRWRSYSQTAFQQKGDLAWNLIVSFAEQDVKDLYGIDGQNNISDIVNVAMNKMFLDLKLDPANMIWWEDYHTNTDNPHMHITFMERNHTRDRGKLTSKELKHVKDIFVTEIVSKRKFRERYGMSHEQALKESEQLKRGIVDEVQGLKFEDYRDIFNLYLQLPKTGRLQYNSLNMLPFREDLDKIVDRLLNIDPIKQDYQTYKDNLAYLASNINEVVNEKVTNIEDVEDKKLRIQVANTILKSMKSFSGNMIQETMKDRKFETEKEMLKDLNKTLDSGMLTSLRLAAKGNYKVAVDQIMNKPDSPERNLALATVLMLHSSKEGDWTKGYVLMNLSAKKGNKEAKRFVTYHKRKYELRKGEHRYLANHYGPKISAAVRKAVNQKTTALDEEIRSYLHNNEEIAPQTYDDIKVEHYIRT
jgi:hypothetical protein